MAFHDPLRPPPRDRESVRRRAMDQFAVPRQPSSQIQHELSVARIAADANTAKLRTLRLMKEATDREAAAVIAAAAPPPKAKKPRKKFILG